MKNLYQRYRNLIFQEIFILIEMEEKFHSPGFYQKEIAVMSRAYLWTSKKIAKSFN